MTETREPFRHRIRVRYGEVDAQNVVFNAHYMAYIDDALEAWVEGLGELRQRQRWDMMLKQITLEWQGSVGNRDWLDIDVEARRFGRTSFDVGYVGSCDGRPVFEAVVVYVSVELGTTTPMVTPEAIRTALTEMRRSDSSR